MFRTKERIAFNLQVQPAMQLYKAVHGRFPPSEEEFFSEIIEKNGIKLPELPAGQRYLYDTRRAASMRVYDADDPPLRVVGAE